MVAVRPLPSCLLVILLIGAQRSYGKRTEIKGDAGLDTKKAKEVHKAVSTLLEHKIGKKLKEAADEVKQAVDSALGKHLDNAHHILHHKDADMIVMDPKLSKLVKSAVKDGKKHHKSKSKAHDLPPHASRFTNHHARHPMGHQPHGYRQPGYPQQRPGYPQQRPGYSQQRPGYPQQRPGYPQQRPGYPGYPQSPGQYQQQQGYQGYPGAGYPTSPGYQTASTPSPGYPATPGSQAGQSYQAPMQGAQAQPCGAAGGCAQGYGAQQSPYMANGCPQSCNQNCYLLCPRKCCADKKDSVGQNKKSKVHHGKHPKHHARIHRKKGRKHHRHHHRHH